MDKFLLSFTSPPYSEVVDKTVYGYAFLKVLQFRSLPAQSNTANILV